jgi:hypothetical protein
VLKRATVVIAALISLAGCNVETVDQGPAIAVGDKFYEALKARDGKAALSLFAPAFKSSEKEWPRLLGSMQEKNGAVASADLHEASLAAQDESPCYLLVYAVKRDSLASDEKLFVCRAQSGSDWAISGHELTRLDTKESISGGMVPTEVGVHVP